MNDRCIESIESFNPTGSYKDRMALAMVEEAEKRGDLRPGMAVVEYTGLKYLTGDLFQA